MTNEELESIRARLDAVPNIPWNASLLRLLAHDVSGLLAEVERLRSDPLPAAAWVREVQQAAFHRGVAAMREAAAKHFECPALFDFVAPRIRALPDPEDK
jgi:hypothetical protein